MPTLLVLLIIFIVGAVIFILEYFKKEKFILDLVKSPVIEENKLIRKECVKLVNQIKSRKGLKYDGYRLYLPSGESLWIANQKNTLPSLSNGLKFRPTKTELEIIWRVIKDLDLV